MGGAREGQDPSEVPDTLRGRRPGLRKGKESLNLTYSTQPPRASEPGWETSPPPLLPQPNFIKVEKKNHLTFYRKRRKNN